MVHFVIVEIVDIQNANHGSCNFLHFIFFFKNIRRKYVGIQFFAVVLKKNNDSIK